MGKTLLALMAAGALALGVTSCPSPTNPKPEPEPTTPEKHSPKITSNPILSVNEGQTYNYQIEATDEDGDALNYSIVTGPAWLTVSPTGLVSGTAPIIDADTIEPIKFKVSDGENEVQGDFNLRNKDLETRAAITGAADRLILLQDNNGLPSVKGNPSGAVDGSWDWDVTNKTGPTNTTYLNIAGVTGHCLLDALKNTSDSKYLDAAKKNRKLYYYRT